MGLIIGLIIFAYWLYALLTEDKEEIDKLIEELGEEWRE